MNDINIEKYKRVLHAIDTGCDKTALIRERFGQNGVYILKKLVKLGCISKESGSFYRKIQDLPFTN